MKKQILLVVLMLCSVSVWAVSLPSSSYNSSWTLQDIKGTQIERGATYVNSSDIGTIDSGCIYDPATIGSSSLYTLCTSCCEPYFVECLMQGKGPAYCGEYVNLPCVNKCQEDSEALGDSPLDASVWMLLAMAVAYGAYAYYQKRQTA